MCEKYVQGVLLKKNAYTAYCITQGHPLPLSWSLFILHCQTSICSYATARYHFCACSREIIYWTPLVHTLIKQTHTNSQTQTKTVEKNPHTTNTYTHTHTDKHSHTHTDTHTHTQTHLLLQITLGDEDLLGPSHFLVPLEATPLFVLDLPQNDGRVFCNRHQELIVVADLQL